MMISLLAEATGNANPYWLLAPLGIGGFLLLLLAVAMIERRNSLPYVRVPMESVQALSPYVRRMSDDVNAEGFVFGDYIAHAKPSIKICGTVWLSRDGRTLVVTSSGTVSRLRSKQTFLISPLNDGTYLCTTDNVGESDPSRLLRFKRRWNGLFADLWKLHQKRLSSEPFAVTAFRQSAPFDILTEIYGRRTQAMNEKGLARYADADQAYWRHTFLGALHICGGLFVQLGDAARQFWRMYLPGAGSAV
ncbi:MAG: hypothetical protein ABSB42_13575 [Tepidisphaeraceae bacterium]|jgi:hypothetical protein